jgi:hypothetical protein
VNTLEPNPKNYTPEMLAELLEAADRRINVLSREVERSIGSRTSAVNAGRDTPTAHLPTAAPPASPSRLRLPALPDGFRLPAMPDVKAAVSKLTARWWRQGLGVVAVAAGSAVGIAFFPGSTPAERPEHADAMETAQSGPPAEGTSMATPAAAAAAAVAPASRAALTMTLSANAPCWVRAVADGVQTIERMLKVGETIEVRAEDQVVLRVGDAGALSVSVNGRAAAAVGPRGQVVTRRFSRRDYTAPAAS